MVAPAAAHKPVAIHRAGLMKTAIATSHSTGTVSVAVPKNALSPTMYGNHAAFAVALRTAVILRVKRRKIIVRVMALGSAAAR